MSRTATPRGSPRGVHNSEIIDLTFLTEDEEIALRSVLEEDLRIQQAEENRLKSLRQHIGQEAMGQSSSRPGTQCARCGTRFGWIFNTGAFCPTCSERVCKSDRLYHSYAHTWMCTLCDKRMKLHTSEEVLSRSYGPSNILRLSFRERKRHQQLDKQQQRPVKQHDQQLKPVTMETQPPPVITTGAQPVTKPQPVTEQPPSAAKQPPSAAKQPAVPAITKQPPEQVPSEPIARSSPVINKRNVSTDLPRRSSPVLTKHTSAPLDTKPKILGITEPLPQPTVVLTAASPEHDKLESEKPKNSTVAKETSSTLVAPYPPGVMIKRNPSITIQGNIYIKLYVKTNKRLVVKMEKATGLAAADYGKTSDPFALTYILPDHRRLTKKKTRVELRTLNPVWDAYWEYPVSEDYTGQVLWISVWDWNRFARSEFLGEVMLPLWTLDLTDRSVRSYALETEHSVPQSAGDLQLSLRFERPEADDVDNKRKKAKEGRLHVHIMEARGLFYDNSYVKCFLRPGKLKAHLHQQTHIITQPKNPVYDEDIVFERVTMENLANSHVLEVTVWDALFSAQPMGVLRLGPHLTASSKPWMDSKGAELSHWEAMLVRPNEWVEQWHVLRPDADFRKVSANNGSPLPDTSGFTDSYEAMRSSPEEDEQSQPRQRSSSLETMPILVYPGDAKPVVSQDQHPGVRNVATFPRQQNPLQLDDYDLRELTKENTKLNRSGSSASSVSNSPTMKKQVSLLLTEQVKEIPPLPLATSEDNAFTARSDSFTNSLTLHSDMSDMQSVYSGSAMFTENEVTGEIQMGLSYSDIEQMLKISINKARGLNPPSDNESSTSPYVKTYMLPDRSKATKKKTAVKKGVDPIFNEIIKYPIKRQHLSNHTLLVGVWHNDFWRHNQFLGEVTLPLVKVDMSNPSDKWYSLEESSHESSQNTDRGKLKVSLQFKMVEESKQKGTLEVSIISGHGLLQAERTCNPVVKCHLLPDYKKKFKTRVYRDSTNPVWNEKFEFEKLKLEDLRTNRVVELTVWDLPRNTKHYDFIGGLRLGPRPQHEKQVSYMDSSDTELSHWTSVMDYPGHCVEQLHTLRHNMNSRPVTLATQQPASTPANQTTASHDITTTVPTTAHVSSIATVTSQDDVARSHDPIPQYEPAPVTAAMVTQPSIMVTEESPPEIRTSRMDTSPVRAERMKFDDDDDDISTATPPQQKMSSLPVSPSMDSISSAASVYSQAGGGKGHYDITGSLCLAVHHSNNQLIVNVKSAKDIAGVNSNKSSNSYVKLYLLPDPNKETKKKTRTVRRSVNPEFNEEFTYDGSLAVMESHTLQVSVWNRDRFGHNKFLGEVRLLLGEVLLSDTAHHWYPLQEMADEDEPVYVGDIRVMLQYIPEPNKKGKKKGRGSLIVWIQQARQLKIVRSGATFVQCTMLPRGKSERFKSDIIHGNSNPTYNAKFRFDKLTDVELSYDRALEITIWEPYRSTNEFVGGIRLGPRPQPGNKEWMDSIGSEVSQWELMTARPEQWADEWHALRSSMKPRDILF